MMTRDLKKIDQECRETIEKGIKELEEKLDGKKISELLEALIEEFEKLSEYPRKSAIVGTLVEFFEMTRMEAVIALGILEAVKHQLASEAFDFLDDEEESYDDAEELGPKSLVM